MELNELRNIRTGIVGIDWIISKGDLFDFSNDEYIEYTIIFLGEIAHSEISEIRKALNDRGNIIIKDTEEETIMIAVDFGKFQSTRNRIRFKLSYTAYK
jgi:hypothetical protein